MTQSASDVRYLQL